MSFSPDGQAAAFVRERSRASAPARDQTALATWHVRTDVWIQTAPGQPARNVTNGQSDHTGWWAPTWSNDGQKLAMMSTRGGSAVTLWVWERSKDRVRQVSTQAVHFSGSARSVFCYAWVDDGRLLVLAPMEGDVSPAVEAIAETPRLAMKAWTRAARGELTVNVVDSLQFKEKPLRLLVVDVETGKTRPIGDTADGPRQLDLGEFPDESASSSWWLAPDGRTVAFVKPTPTAYGEVAARKLGVPRALELRTITGEPIQLNEPLPENIQTDSVRFSPDGRQLAFFANGPGPVNPILLYGQAASEVMTERVASLENPAKLYRVHLAERQIERVDTRNIDLGKLGAPYLTWSAQGDLMTLASPKSGDAAMLAAARQSRESSVLSATRVWWVLDGQNHVTPLLTEGRAPKRLLRAGRNGDFMGVANGDLWRVDVAGRALKNLTADFAPAVTGLGAIDNTASQVERVVIVASPEKAADPASTKAGAKPAYFVLDLASGKAEALARPVAAASLAAFSSASKHALYIQDDAEGTLLWRSGGTAAADKLVEFNTYRKSIARTSCQMIDYTSLDGVPLKAGLCLPLDYVKGRRYPLVVGVRIDTPPNAASYTSPAPYDGSFAPYAAVGFAFLWPNIPQNMPGMETEEGDSLLLLPNSILPAVDKAVALGIADSDRVFVEGGSRGGWTVMGLIGLTSRFKAAVASAGYTDHLNYAGGALPRLFITRYSDNPFRYSNTSGILDYHPTEVPFWRDGDRIRRNDAMSYVDRVRTPLMIIHGDLDGADMTEPEEFFQALTAMRKRAQFVRYWGEGHGTVSPLNVLDRFRRTIAWYDEFGDISRDAQGRLIFDGDRVKSRNGAPPLKPEDFTRFGPAAASDGSAVALYDRK